RTPPPPALHTLSLTTLFRSAAPEIPTVDEAGLPGFYISVWRGLWAAKGTPREVIAKLNAAVVDALADPAVQQRLAELGQELPSRDRKSTRLNSSHLGISYAV